MWILHQQFVTHCQRRLAAKFQFIKRLRKTDKHIIKYLYGYIRLTLGAFWNIIRPYICRLLPAFLSQK